MYFLKAYDVPWYQKKKKKDNLEVCTHECTWGTYDKTYMVLKRAPAKPHAVMQVGSSSFLSLAKSQAETLSNLYA